VRVKRKLQKIIYMLYLFILLDNIKRIADCLCHYIFHCFYNQFPTTFLNNGEYLIFIFLNET